MPVRLPILKYAKRLALLVGIALVVFLAIRIYDTQSGPPLELWHTFIPPEMAIDELEEADWQQYLDAENEALTAVEVNVTQKLVANDRVPINRYFAESPIYPPSFSRDWNRSYVLEPEGELKGAVVFLHGLTDSPYSLRHVAARYRDHGFVSIAIRLPGHGTVPAGLVDVEWEEWMAATRLAVREAWSRISPDLPLHVVGFSNGGALALKYTLDAIDNPELLVPDRLVLFSPMIGITRFARFAGLAGLPALLPSFAKAAWLGIVPEFNPFKYNSFPVNGARQSWQVTQVLQDQIQHAVDDGRIGQLPPILTFQSVADFTVSTRAIITALYAHLPENGSELVLFDLNRDTKLGTLLRVASNTNVDRLLPKAPRNFRTTIIANAALDSSEVVARVMEPGEIVEQITDIGLAYPPGVFSLSHLALPFPLSDGLYGLDPDPNEDYGINLGSVAPRGERGTLIVSLDALLRMSSNPFYPYMMDRVDQVIPQETLQ